MLEIINLKTLGLATYNFKHHVASDVGVDRCVSQQTIYNLKCTNRKIMKRNEAKGKIMVQYVLTLPKLDHDSVIEDLSVSVFAL